MTAPGTLPPPRHWTGGSACETPSPATRFNSILATIFGHYFALRSDCLSLPCPTWPSGGPGAHNRVGSSAPCGVRRVKSDALFVERFLTGLGTCVGRGERSLTALTGERSARFSRGATAARAGTGAQPTPTEANPEKRRHDLARRVEIRRPGDAL